jgi:outer membrane protein OmpA-like peptidoglycan-associated protein
VARRNSYNRNNEEEESAFVSMTDLMISILFIVMILMAFFARSVSQTEQETVAKSEYDRVVKIMQEQKEQIHNLELLVDEKELIIKELKEIIETLKKQIQLKNIEISQKDNRIKAQKASIDKQELKIIELKEIIETLKKQIQLKNIEIKNKDTELTKKDQIIETKQKTIDEKEKEIKRLQSTIEKLRERLKQLTKIKDTELARILDEISQTRTNILNSIKLKLEDKGIQVQVDTVSGIIRFDNSVIKFASGRFKPSREVKKIIQNVAEILEDELSCFSLGPSSSIDTVCNPSLSILEAVQIEGHTDNIPLGSMTRPGLQDNLDLSAKRAAAAFRIMKEHRKGLMDFENANFLKINKTSDVPSLFEVPLLQGQPLLSVSGYGDMRPVVSNSTEARAGNRRIDLRVIMTTPKSVQEADQLADIINHFLKIKDNQQ